MNRRFTDKKRGAARRNRKPILFLSVEGRNRTEKIYLDALNKDHERHYSIQYAPGRKTDVSSMWRALLVLMKDVFSEADGDKAYCICDTDFESYKLERIHEIKAESIGTNARVIVSNPSFEIWYLNHFEYSTKQYIDRNDLKADLEKYIPGYDKSVDYYIRYLKSKTQDAIRHSIRQLQVVNINHDATTVPGNGSTELAEIVQAIITE